MTYVLKNSSCPQYVALKNKPCFELKTLRAISYEVLKRVARQKRPVRTRPSFVAVCFDCVHAFPAIYATHRFS